MNIVVAIIQPFKLEAVRDALTQVGVSGMTVTEVRGFGHQMGHTEIYRGSEYTVRFVPKIKVEAVVPASLVDRVVDAIMKSAFTGQIGDGKIFVSSVDSIFRIRTGETDIAAL